MNIQYLEHVLALAQTLNFTKAANYMHITQPAFSRIISNVENEVGFIIFDRGKRNIQLTPAGKAFVESISKSIKYYQEGVTAGLNSSEKIQEPVTLGYIPDALNSDLRCLVSSFRQEHPDIGVVLEEAWYFEVQEAVMNGVLDVAMVTLNPEVIPEKCSYNILEQYELYVAVPPKHHLADMERIKPETLAQEVFIELCYNKVYSRNWNVLQYVGKKCGFTPIVFSQTTTLSSLILQVVSGEGISVITKPVAEYWKSMDSIRFIPLADITPSARMLLWNEETATAEVCCLLDHFKLNYRQSQTEHYRF